MAENFNWSNISSTGKSLGLNANINASLNQGYSQSGESNGSVNSAESWNNAQNGSTNDAYSYSQSGTNANEARMWSALMADWAWQRDMEAMNKQMDFNREEAQKQRDWQAEMANSIYTRSVKNMKEAGINPILAYNMGLSGASVGTGATASLAGVPSAPLAQNFMDSWSASESYSHGSSWGNENGGSYGNGSSWGAGWANSEEGIVTALQGLGSLAGNALAGINAGQALEKLGANGKGIVKGVVSAVDNGIKNITGQKTFNDTWRNYNSNSGNGSKNGSKNPYQRSAG